MEDDWQRKLEQIERTLDGVEAEDPSPRAPAKSAAKKSELRVLRWTAIGVGGGLGLAIAYYLLKPLVVLLLLAGVGYGAYRYYKLKSDKGE